MTEKASHLIAVDDSTEINAIGIGTVDMARSRPYIELCYHTSIDLGRKANNEEDADKLVDLGLLQRVNAKNKEGVKCYALTDKGLEFRLHKKFAWLHPTLYSTNNSQAKECIEKIKSGELIGDLDRIEFIEYIKAEQADRDELRNQNGSKPQLEGYVARNMHILYHRKRGLFSRLFGVR